ncbi:MAG: hypothetical protein WA435_12135 [Gallionellaceae bacterium]
MMKVAVGVLLVIILFLAWRLNVEMGINNQLQSNIARLTLKLSDKTAGDNLELQEKCATQADMVFRELGYSLSKDLATNQSHFNSKLNKCFMSFMNTSGNYSVRYLLDAYEQREYAEFSSSFHKNGNLIGCHLAPLGEKEIRCNSEGEYNEFVARYME